MQRRNKLLLSAAAAGALALGLPAIAQDRPESILPPGFGDAPKPAATPTPSTSPASSSPATAAAPAAADEGGGVEEVNALDSTVETADQQSTRQADIPATARRDPAVAGLYSPESKGLPAQPWGRMNGQALATILRGTQAPVALRWADIGLRGALTVSAPAPGGIDPVDWTAERTMLLLRMGEADAARLLAAQIDNDRYTPKMQQVALQTALATSDPAAMCVAQDNLAKVEPNVSTLVNAICAALSGQPERAAADIQTVRRRGQLAPIDIALADKVVGAAADTGRAVTVEWEPVDSLNSWRFGLSSATAMMPPDRLVNAASLQTRAWLARAPMFSPEARLPSARIAAAMGVFSNKALVDLYSQIYDSTDPDSLGSSDAWRLRLAYVGKDRDARLDAMRHLWKAENDPTKGLAGQILLARAARYVEPSSDIGDDAPNLVASLLSGGFDREAARWVPIISDLSKSDATPVWAMLAVGAPNVNGIDISKGRIGDFYSADKSEGTYRTNLLIASLAGLGRIDRNAANSLSGSYELGLDEQTGWTRMIDAAADRGEAGSVIVLASLALQGQDLATVKPVYMYHLTSALRRTGQDYLARMIAAEAVYRT